MVKSSEEAGKAPDAPEQKGKAKAKKPETEVETPEAYCCNLDCGPSCVLVTEEE